MFGGRRSTDRGRRRRRFLHDSVFKEHLRLLLLSLASSSCDNIYSHVNLHFEIEIKRTYEGKGRERRERGYLNSLYLW